MKRSILIVFIALVLTHPACDTARQSTRQTETTPAAAQQEKKPAREEPVPSEVQKKGDVVYQSKKAGKEKSGTLTWGNYKYVGEIRKGKPHGKGVLYKYDSKGNLISKMEGMFNNGVAEGDVVVTEYDPSGKVTAVFTGT
nr:hypothetical protein [Spirochaetota bacterium]